MESKEAEGIMNRIFAGIVSFEPDIERLRCNIDAIAPQVCAVVIFDNGSSNYREIRKSIKNAVLIRSEKNLGIAAALNRLIRWGERKGYKWMISLDQDSVCPTDYVKDMLPLLDLKRVGIAAPVIIDRSIGVVGHSPKGSYAEVRTCITSGAFNSIAAWCKVSGYDESMFIDSVDFEYCYRLRKHGYRVVQSGKVWLLHEVGNSQKTAVPDLGSDSQLAQCIQKILYCKEQYILPPKAQAVATSCERQYEKPVAHHSCSAL